LAEGQDHFAARLAAEDALRTSDERFRLIVDSLPSPCAMYDAERRFLFVNRALTQSLRLTPEQMIGRRDEEVLPSYVTAAYLPHLCRAVETGLPQRAECSFRGKAGSFDYIASYVPLVDAEGRVREVLGVSYDITHQKRVEQELRRRDDELRSLADNVPDITARLDRDGRHLYINRRIEAVTGMPAESFLGKTDRELGMPAQLLAEWDRTRLLAFDTGEPVESTFDFPTPAGVRHYEMRLIPERSADGSVATVLAIVRDITDRKRLELALRESEEHYRLVVEDQTEVICRFNAEGVLTFVNDVYCRFFGKSSGQLLGRRWHPQAVSEDVPMIEERLRTLSPANRVVVTENRIYSGTGEVRWMQFVNRGFFDGEGCLVETQCVGRDITDCKLAEMKLTESVDRIRSAFHAAPIGIVLANFDGTFIRVNQAFCKMLGYAHSELSAMNVMQVNHPLDAAETTAHRDDLPGGERPPIVTHKRYVAKDGRTVWARVTSTVVSDQNGRPLYDLAMIEDVTGQKLAQAKLNESDERFRSSFEAAPIGMILIGLDHKLLKVNQAFCGMLGYSEEELTGVPIMRITHPSDEAATAARLEALSGGGPLLATTEKRYVAKDGRVVWARVTSTAVRDSEGRRLYGLAQIEDITASRLVKQELEQYRAHLEELVRSRTRALEASQQTLRSAERLASLGTLAAGIAHEINNPVGTILLAAEMALAAQVTDDEETVTRCLDAIKADTKRCGRIVKNVLNFARQEPTEKWPHQLNDVVRQAIDRVQVYASRRDATLSTSLDDDVGLVLMNPIAIEQALTNLLRNAVESRPERISVRVATTTAEHSFTVTIAADGPGMLPDVQQHIFDPFFTTRRAAGGMGLGLSLVHGTVSDHQGRIRVDSAIGEGTTFTIEFTRYQGST